MRFAGSGGEGESGISRRSRECAGADMGRAGFLLKPGVENTGSAVDGFILRAGMKSVRMGWDVMRVSHAPTAAPLGPARAGLNLEVAFKIVSERRDEDGDQREPFLGVLEVELGRTWEVEEDKSMKRIIALGQLKTT